LEEYSSFDTDSEEALERWKNKLYKVSNRRCTRITKSVHWIGSELCDPLKFDGTEQIDAFIEKMEESVPKN
jgi:hypothetical protein